MKIYRAKVEEVPEIKKVLSETWVDTYGRTYSQETIQKVTTEWHNPELLASQIQNPDFFFGIAKEDNHIVGLTTVRKLDEETIMMYRLYVHPDYQRHGIGTKLMEEAIKSFPGAKKLRIEVEEQNQKGISFYRKQGFKELGKKIEKVGNDTLPTVEMEKNL